MNYRDWEPLYLEILEDFGFSQEQDQKAARLLDSFIETSDITVLGDMIRDREVSVFGAGPSLEDIEDLPVPPIIAADGATSFLLAQGIVPDAVVTDLDGNPADLVKAVLGGSVMVVHGHGDNMGQLRRYVPPLVEKGRVIGTCQCTPVGKIHNFGGFTDGDRCVFLADHFGAKKISLYGMDFYGEIGKYSFSEDTPVKRKKLAWASRLIDLVMEERED